MITKNLEDDPFEYSRIYTHGLQMIMTGNRVGSYTMCKL